jgi:flagellin-like hook-associated protein FlgL
MLPAIVKEDTMPIVVNTNSVATIASFNAGAAMKKLQQSVNRLSSGKRIVSPADDAGGLSVHYKLQSVLKRTEATRNNLHNGVSFLQVQDGANQVAGRILDRMAELRTFWQDISKNDYDRQNYNYEFKELQEQLALIEKEKFNGVDLYSRDPYDNNPIKIITTEDGKTGVVDITRTGLFDHIDVSDTYRERMTNPTFGGAYGGTAEPKLVKNFESNASYNKGDIIRGRFEDGQIRHAVALEHIGEAVAQQDLLRLGNKQEQHTLTVDATSAKGDNYVVTLGIGGTDHVITTEAVTDSDSEGVAKALAQEINAKGLSVAATVVGTVITLKSNITGTNGDFTVTPTDPAAGANLTTTETQSGGDVATDVTTVTFNLADSTGTAIGAALPITYDNDGTTETITSMVTAINADAALSAVVTAKANGDGSFILTAKEPGAAFTATLTTDAAALPDAYTKVSTVIAAESENWSAAGRAFEDQHESLMLLWNGDPVSRVFHGNLTVSNPTPDLRVIADQQGIPQTVVLDQNVTGYQANQVVTINLNNGAHGTVQANESGTITKGSIIQVVNNGDGSFTAGEQTVSGVLGGISTAGDTYEPGEVVFNESDRNYYLAVGQGGDYTQSTQTAAYIGQNSGEFVKIGDSMPAIRDYEAFSQDSVYARNDMVYYQDKVYVAVSESVSGTAVNGQGEYITPENDANDAFWLEISNYSGQGSGILDMTKDLGDFQVSQFVDYIQVMANSRAIGGGEMSRLNYSDDILIQNQINLEAADGRIIDADIALESTRMARNQVLTQASVSMVAQANSLASLVLSLLQN